MCKHCSAIREVHFSTRLQAFVGVDLVATTDGLDMLPATQQLGCSVYTYGSNVMSVFYIDIASLTRQCMEAEQGTRCYCWCEETAVLIVVGLAVLGKPRFPSVRSGWRDHLSMSCIVITAIENYT